MALVLRPPTERESLPDRLADLGRARRRVAVATGLFALVAVVLGLVTFFCILDAAFHLSPFARAVALVVVLSASGVVWLRGVSRAIRGRTDALSVAIALESQFPSFNDSLASAVSFLDLPAEEDASDQPRASQGVSGRLRATAIRLAERKAARLPLDNFVLTGRCWQTGWLCAAVIAISLPLALWYLPQVEIALARLADPFGMHAWPTKTQLELLSPQFPARIAKGEAFELKFAVRGTIPGAAVVRVRMQDGEESGNRTQEGSRGVASQTEFEEQFPLTAGNDPEHPRAAVITARIDPGRIPHNFAIRILANDADSDWYEVAVVPAPRLVALDGRPTPQFHITPPAYTGLAPLQLPDGAAVIEVPVGTAVQFRAATDVALSSAVLTFAGDKSAVVNAAPVVSLGQLNPIAAIVGQEMADQLGADIPIALSGNRTRLSADFIPPLSGTYALRLTDDTGLTGTRLIELRLTADPTPTVTLDRPTAGTDPPFLAPTASLTVAVAADDKLYGVRSSFIEYRVGRDGAIHAVPLAQVPNAHPPAVAALIGGPVASALPQSRNVAVSRVIPVRAFVRDDGMPVREGDLLIVRGAADDWDDVSPLKGPGRSPNEMEIRIASPEAIEAWIQRELAAFRPELIRLREQQRDARQKVGDVVVQPGGSVNQPDRDKLVTAEQMQRQLRGKIADLRNGLRAKADLLRATTLANRLPKSHTTDRVEVLATELGRTADRDLGTAEQALAEARQIAGEMPKPGQEELLNDSLRLTARHQKKVEDTATTLLDLLSQWGGAGEIRGEARALRDAILRQLAANEQLKEHVPEGKLDPSPEEQRELDRAAAKSDQAAEQASQLIARAARLAGEKDRQAAELRAQADAKDTTATDLRLRAADTTNPVQKSVLNANADDAATSAADLRVAADRTMAEADALRKAISAAGGQDLPRDLREAASALRKNQQARSGTLMKSAVSRLDALTAALTETAPDAVPELARPKQLKAAADQLDALAAAQEELRQKAEAASRIADSQKRKAAFAELAKEQDRLIDRGRELLQKLTRERADDAAHDTRVALDKMEAARDDLEKGRPPQRAQSEAVDRLDSARDRLDVAAAHAGRQLSEEKRRKLADKVKSLVERQKAALAEASRIHADVAHEKGWDRLLRTSYSDLESVREKEIAIEVRALAERELASLPVLARLLSDTARAIDKAREKIKARCEDDLGAAFDPELESLNDRKVSRPMQLALRRLEQLAEALKPDDSKQKGKKAANSSPGNDNQANAGAGGHGEQDVVPPLAQLKVLRSLQAELNERTVEFAKEHPDPDTLTVEEKIELREIEKSQREVAELFEEIAKMFDKKGPPGPEFEKDKKPAAPEGQP